MKSHEDLPKWPSFESKSATPSSRQRAVDKRWADPTPEVRRCFAPTLPLGVGSVFSCTWYSP